MQNYILGIDLGGTKVNAAVLDADNRVVGRARAKTRAWRDDEEVFNTIARTGHKAIEKARFDLAHLEAIGIGTPGPIDIDSGYIIEAANLKFKNFPLGPRLSEEFGRPVIVDNDVNAGVYGEFKAGAGRGATEVVGMFIGTGIGGGLIINGALYHGFSKNTGEVGHTIIKAGGPRCGCGNRGCLESLASRTAMTRDIRKAIKQGHKTSVASLLKKNTDTLTGQALREAYRAGDRLVLSTVHRAAKFIGIGIGNMVNLFGPEVFVLGGGVIEAMDDDFIARIDRAARKVALNSGERDFKIVRSELGDDAGVIGAALLAREALNRQSGKKLAVAGGE